MKIKFISLLICSLVFVALVYGANVMSTFTWSFTVMQEPDNTPPYTEGYNPLPNQENVEANTNIVVHVKDDIRGVDINTIVMKVNGSIVIPVVTGTPADYTLTYDPPSNFVFNSTVTVTVDADDLP